MKVIGTFTGEYVNGINTIHLPKIAVKEFGFDIFNIQPHAMFLHESGGYDCYCSVSVEIVSQTDDDPKSFFTFIESLTKKISIEDSYIIGESNIVLKIMRQIIGDAFQIHTSTEKIQIWQNKRFPEQVYDTAPGSYFFLEVEPETLEQLSRSLSQIEINYKKYEEDEELAHNVNEAIAKLLSDRYIRINSAEYGDNWETFANNVIDAIGFPEEYKVNINWESHSCAIYVIV